MTYYIITIVSNLVKIKGIMEVVISLVGVVFLLAFRKLFLFALPIALWALAMACLL